MNTIITIGRSFGSGGGYVGHAVARTLGIPFYDNELISKVAEENGYSRDLFSGGEKKRSIFSTSSFFTSGRTSLANPFVGEDVLFKAQSDVIRSIAEKGDSVLIGRCADYILRDHPCCLNVFVTAPVEFRIQRLIEVEGLTAEEAERLMRRKDRTREAYYNYYTFGAWGHASNYHLCVDSSLLGIEGSADLIIEFGRRAGRIRA